MDPQVDRSGWQRSSLRKQHLSLVVERCPISADFFCLGLWVLLLIVGWLQLAGLCQLSLCVLVWASPDPNYLLQDWVTFFMPTWSPGTYPVRARTGTPSRGGGEWGLYFSFSKGIKWLRVAYTFSCLSMNCHPCSSQAQSIMVCCASWWLWQHTLWWNTVLSVFFSLDSGSWLSSRLAFAVPFSTLVLPEYLQPQLLLGYRGMTKAYGVFFFLGQ